ncbi:hypothetical protein [Candidatus Clostridium stratigraminis]|uniref:Uncharacterized protein n=1 Tax=Candidatus Clostridium stratigraminis TaxID=3381661 RepID=A0ABW8T1V8_9CLOT
MPNGSGVLGDLARHIGQTVTIFTTSGGESGRGFTGVLISVNNGFVRLITTIGAAPGCALGNCCDVERRNGAMGRDSEFNEFSNELGEMNNEDNRNTNRNRIDCTGRTLGDIVDIPINRIAAFVHNSVGSSGW